jgi:hypothetical protein
MELADVERVVSEQHDRLYDRLAAELRQNASVDEQVRERVQAALLQERRQIEEAVRGPLMGKHCQDLAEVKARLQVAEAQLKKAQASDRPVGSGQGPSV